MCWWTLRLWFLLNCVYFFRFFPPFSVLFLPFFVFFPPLSVLSFLFLSSSILFPTFRVLYSALLRFPLICLFYPCSCLSFSFLSLLPFFISACSFFLHYLFLTLIPFILALFTGFIMYNFFCAFRLSVPLINFYLLLFRCSDYSSDVLSISL